VVASLNKVALRTSVAVSPEYQVGRVSFLVSLCRGSVTILCRQSFCAFCLNWSCSSHKK